MDSETAQNPETTTERTSKKDRINRDAFTGKAPKENWAELAEQEPLPEPEEYVPPVQSQTTETSKFEIHSRSTGRGGARKGTIERYSLHGRQGGKPGERKDQQQSVRDPQSRSSNGFEVQLSGIPSSATVEQIKDYLKTFGLEIAGEPRLTGSRSKYQTMSVYVDMKDKQNYAKAIELEEWEFTDNRYKVKFSAPKTPMENSSRGPRDERTHTSQHSSFFASSQRDQQHQHSQHQHHRQQPKPQPEKPLEPEVTVARPEELRIKILPRGATAANASSPTEDKPKTAKADPFGGAKPRDESEYNRKRQEEEEKKRQQEAEEKAALAAQAAPEAETQAKAEEADAQATPAANASATETAAASTSPTTGAEEAVPAASEVASPSGKTHKPAGLQRSSDFNQAIRAPADSEWVRGAAPEPKPAEPKQKQPFQKGYAQQGDKKKPLSAGAKSAAAFDAPVLPKPSAKKNVIKKPESTKVDLRSTNIYDALNAADSDEE